jgi:hypothetical protein
VPRASAAFEQAIRSDNRAHAALGMRRRGATGIHFAARPQRRHAQSETPPRPRRNANSESDCRLDSPLNLQEILLL